MNTICILFIWIFLFHSLVFYSSSIQSCKYFIRFIPKYLLFDRRKGGRKKEKEKGRERREEWRAIINGICFILMIIHSLLVYIETELIFVCFFLHLATLLNLLLRFLRYCLILWIPWYFLHRQSHHMQVGTILFLPFQSIFLSFFFSLYFIDQNFHHYVK